jgi:hypothetical protein
MAAFDKFAANTSRNSGKKGRERERRVGHMIKVI